MTQTDFLLEGLPPAKLVVDGVSKWFRTPRANIQALDKINLNVGEGEFACLVGPSGCGKTTLLDILAGLTKPDEGKCWRTIDASKVPAVTDW
jgi:ABC-type Fe3+/spermidine/putrescine transport system ATPase subunit